jgi:hypothetical protein
MIKLTHHTVDGHQPLTDYGLPSYEVGAYWPTPLRFGPLFTVFILPRQ